MRRTLEKIPAVTVCRTCSNVSLTPRPPPAALKVVDGKLDAVQLAVKDTLRASGILDKFCFTLIDLDDLVLHGHKYDYVVQDGAFRSSEDFGILRGYGKFA